MTSRRAGRGALLQTGIRAGRAACPCAHAAAPPHREPLAALARAAETESGGEAVLICFGGDGTFNCALRCAHRRTTPLLLRHPASAARHRHPRAAAHTRTRHRRAGVASTVLSLREEGHSSFTPHLVPCPLGTGNDLSRVLGWGSGFPGFAAVPRIVAAARAAPLGTQLDVWSVAFGRTARGPAFVCVCVCTVLTWHRCAVMRRSPS